MGNTDKAYDIAINIDVSSTFSSSFLGIIRPAMLQTFSLKVSLILCQQTHRTK